MGLVRLPVRASVAGFEGAAISTGHSHPKFVARLHGNDVAPGGRRNALPSFSAIRGAEQHAVAGAHPANVFGRRRAGKGGFLRRTLLRFPGFAGIAGAFHSRGRPKAPKDTGIGRRDDELARRPAKR